MKASVVYFMSEANFFFFFSLHLKKNLNFMAVYFNIINIESLVGFLMQWNVSLYLSCKK